MRIVRNGKFQRDLVRSPKCTSFSGRASEDAVEEVEDLLAGILPEVFDRGRRVGGPCRGIGRRYKQPFHAIRLGAVEPRGHILRILRPKVRK